MRVTPITLYTRQNANFGMFENRKAGVETERIIKEAGRGNDGYDNKDRRKLINFLDQSPYVMVKHNDDITYVVANRAAYESSRNKKGFDEFFDDEVEKNQKMQNDFDNGKRFPAMERELPALRRRLPYIEPDYLMALYDNKTCKDLGKTNRTCANVDNLRDELLSIESNYQRPESHSKTLPTRGDIVTVGELYGYR